MFLSERREFPSTSCLAEKKNLITIRVSMLLKSGASLTCFRACFLPGRAKDLSALQYIFRVCVSSFSYPARKAYAPYYDIICDFAGSPISLHIVSQTARLYRQSCGPQNVCFDFLYNFVWTFLILRRIQRDIIIFVNRS